MFSPFLVNHLVLESDICDLLYQLLPVFDKLSVDFSSGCGCQNYVRFMLYVGEVLLG